MIRLIRSRPTSESGAWETLGSRLDPMKQADHSRHPDIRRCYGNIEGEEGGPVVADVKESICYVILSDEKHNNQGSKCQQKGMFMDLSTTKKIAS